MVWRSWNSCLKINFCGDNNRWTLLLLNLVIHFGRLYIFLTLPLGVRLTLVSDVIEALGDARNCLCTYRRSFNNSKVSDSFIWRASSVCKDALRSTLRTRICCLTVIIEAKSNKILSCPRMGLNESLAIWCPNSVTRPRRYSNFSWRNRIVDTLRRPFINCVWLINHWGYLIAWKRILTWRKLRYDFISAMHCLRLIFIRSGTLSLGDIDHLLEQPRFTFDICYRWFFRHYKF